MGQHSVDASAQNTGTGNQRQLIGNNKTYFHVSSNAIASKNPSYLLNI